MRLTPAGWPHNLLVGAVDTAPHVSRSFDAVRRHAVWRGLLAFGPDAIAVGACALVLHGVHGLPQRIVPQVALPGARRARSRDGVRLCQFDDGMTVVRVAGRYAATPEWALAQAVPELFRETAVAVMDSTLHRGLLTPDALAHAHDLARGRRGVERTHGWWSLADGRAESPLETRARLDCLDGGVPADELQVVIREQNRVIGRGDLGWRLKGGRWLIVEIDGVDVHGTPRAVYADRERQNALLATGRVELLRYTASDVRVPGTVAAGVRRVLRARGADQEVVRPTPAGWPHNLLVGSRSQRGETL